MIRQRVRIRFRKAGDLRLISHRDLVRVLERLFRRCGLALSMSEGFHPKPRLSFPSALALGVCGWNEVMEVELTEVPPADDLRDRLTRHAPPGLTINEVTLVPPGARKPQARSLTYELPVPAARREALRESVAGLLAETAHPWRRADDRPPVDLRGAIEALALDHDRLRLRLAVTPQAGVRPGDVLSALDAADLASGGFGWQRTDVEVVP
jgi:radical SAM-linked protein